ncbi:MAG: pyruvate formate lyase family protein [Chitinophagales bacterium]
MKTSPSTSERSAAQTDRLHFLKDQVTSSPYAICIERAMLITDYFKDKSNLSKPVVIQKAEALANVLTHKSVRIYPDELIVGSTTSKRVAGPLYPELHGLPVMEDLLSFTNRKVNPLQISGAEKLKLVKEVIPFWLTKFLAYKSFSGKELISFMLDQLTPKFYLINETGGIGHFIPDYEMLIHKGINGIIQKANRQMAAIQDATDEQYAFYKAVKIICEAVLRMAENYAEEAKKCAAIEPDITRKNELLNIADMLEHVPARPARTFYEALQSIWMVHTALTLEGLDNGISFGRMDQYLYPFYEQDVKAGVLTKESAKELLGCFTIKSAEIIPVFSSDITEYHGGFLSGQAVTIGGMDKSGIDVTNELSYVFLELMDEIRMRQPNYHARLHPGSPKPYIDKIMTNLTKGVNSPAVYNDEVIVRSLLKCGYSEEDARAYSTLGCVELNAAGKTFGSTDAALVNLPICLEMALNKGRLFGALIKSGCDTPSPETFTTIEDVCAAFKEQLHYQIDRLHAALTHIELGNRNYHPTPLTSSMIQGCLDKGKDVTAGGAVYNFSGVQGRGVTDAADSLYAINELCLNKKYTLSEV